MQTVDQGDSPTNSRPVFSFCCLKESIFSLDGANVTMAEKELVGQSCSAACQIIQQLVVSGYILLMFVWGDSFES